MRDLPSKVTGVPGSTFADVLSALDLHRNGVIAWGHSGHKAVGGSIPVVSPAHWHKFLHPARLARPAFMPPRKSSLKFKCGCLSRLPSRPPCRRSPLSRGMHPAAPTCRLSPPPLLLHVCTSLPQRSPLPGTPSPLPAGRLLVPEVLVLAPCSFPAPLLVSSWTLP